MTNDIITSGMYRTRDGKAQIEWELKRSANGPEFSASGTYSGGCGQCIDAIAKEYPKDEMVQRIFKVWSKYHLNGMHAGLPAQEKFLESIASERGDKQHYDWAVDSLKAAGLYEIPVPEDAKATGGFPKDVVTWAECVRWAGTKFPHRDQAESFLALAFARRHDKRGYRYGERWVYQEIPDSVVLEIESWAAAPQPTDSLYDHNARTFLKDSGVAMRITLSDSKPAPWNTAGHHYRVTMSRKGSRLVFDFWGSVNDKEKKEDPSEYDVLACISSDVYTPDTFEDFCSEYGYEGDSIKAKQTFVRADRFAKRLRAFFSEEERTALSQIQ